MSKQIPRGKTNTRKTKSASRSVHIDGVEAGFGLDPQIIFEVRKLAVNGSPITRI